MEQLRDDGDPTGTPTVTVQGEAAIRIEPDEAYVFITLARTEAAPGPALADVAARTDALFALLEELGVAAADRSTSGVSVDERYDHTKDGREFVGHRAAATASVRFTAMDGIGELVMRATSELEATVDGPNWRVSADHPVRLEAASRATANAQAKASAYANGLGLRIGPVRSLSEPEHPQRFIRAAARSPKSDMPIETGEQEVSAVIQATFELLSP